MSESLFTSCKGPDFGKSPYHDLHFIIKNYAFVIPFQAKALSLYEFSLMLEDLYRVPIKSNTLVGRNIEEIADLLNTTIATQKNRLAPEKAPYFF
ncbi:MAG: hypothetical protein MUC61_02875 [Amoebophilaceae bacterium]|jgi:hypothetical protein|nr:hypothetical protein [Amoebophilaceae bacterium]